MCCTKVGSAMAWLTTASVTNASSTPVKGGFFILIETALFDPRIQTNPVCGSCLFIDGPEAIEIVVNAESSDFDWLARFKAAAY